MAIVDMKPKWSGQDATAEKTTAGATLGWTVTVDDPANDDAEFVKSNIAITITHPSDEDMYLHSARVRRLSPIFFDVEAKYVKNLVQSQEEDPTERPVVVTMPPSVSFSTTEEPVDVDADGEPLRTVNGEGYDPPCLQEFNDLVLTFEKNVSTVDYTEYRTLKGAVSADEFYGFPGGQPRCIDITAKPAQEGEYLFYKQTAVIMFREPLADTPDAKAWYRRLLHEGFYEKVDGKIVRALDENGDETTKPVLLDTTTGARITDPTMAQWKYHRKFREVDFNDYNLV